MSENNQTPNGQQPPFNPQQPNGQQPPYNAQQPNGQQPPYNAQQPYGQQPPYNAQQPYSQQPPYNAQQPYGQQPPYNAQQPYGQQPPYNAQQPYGQQPPYNGQQPYYARPVTDNTKLFSVLSYIWFFWIIGLVADRNNPRVRYHVNQGIILFIFECIFRVISWIIDGIFNVSFWYSGSWIHFFPLGIVNSVLGLITLILTIIGIVHAAQGREEPLPVIGNLFTIVK